jgi:ankyrin repeat protein
LPGSDEELWNAANNDDLAAVSAALAKGPTVNACGSSYERPLHIATSNRNAALVRQLLSAGASPNVRNCPGDTPLVLAAHNNDVKLASLLLDAGADIELRGDLTPLGMAAAHGHVAMLRLLIARGAKPNQAGGGSTPLMLAAGEQHAEAVDLLLEAGANPNWTDDAGGNALFDAVGAFRIVPMKPQERERVLSVVKLLVQHGADVNARTAGQSALQRARALDAPGVATFLIASGARD